MSIQSAPPPLTNEPKPVISASLLNPMLDSLRDNPPVVKFQVITREHQEIVVGRVKIPSPSGHAFILRRFDTGAISLTTMIRAAYPSAPEDVEKSISTWVKNNYIISGANGPTTTQGGRNLRLAGTWIPVNVALALASDYNLLEIIRPLVNALPDPTGSYRKTKQGLTSPEAAPAAARTFPFSPSVPGVTTVAPTLTVPSATSTGSTSPFSGAIGGVHATASAQTSIRAPPPVAQTTPTHPNKRQRTSGPSPSAAETAPVTNGRARTIAVSPLATNGPITAPEEASEAHEVAQSHLFPTIEEDRAESQRLMQALSSSAPAYAPAPIEAAADEAPASQEVASTPSKKTGGRKTKNSRKRAVDDVEPEIPTTFEPVEHSWDTGTEVQRVIAGSRRVEVAKAGALTKLASAVPLPATPDGRKLFWGGLMMATGFAAVAFSNGIPPLFF